MKYHRVHKHLHNHYGFMAQYFLFAEKKNNRPKRCNLKMSSMHVQISEEKKNQQHDQIDRLRE